MSRVVILGGHGKIAIRLAKLLSADGVEVDSVVRNPDHGVEVAAAGASSVVADIESATVDSLAAVIAGHDAVVFSAGAGGGDPARTFAVDRDAAIRAIDAAAAAGVGRFVLVSYFGAGLDHGVPEDNSFHAYAQAKAEADAYLRASDREWTIVAPSSLTLDAGTGLIETADAGATAGEVSRDDVAAVIAAVLQTPATVGRTIEFNNGSTPIDEALASFRS
ncbi:MAG: NAD(P)H-binding protein [Nakamurella sp.]